MRRRDKVVTLAVVGGVLIGIGMFTNSWWTVEGRMVRFGLRNATLCAPGLGCSTVGYELLAVGIPDLHELSAPFLRYASLTFWIGLLASLSLFAHAWLARAGDERRAVGYGAGAASVVTFALAIATAVSFPEPAYGVASSGWSMWATLLGCALGVGAAVPKLIPTAAVAGARDAVGRVGDRIHRGAMGPVADLDRKREPELPEARVHERDRRP